MRVALVHDYIKEFGGAERVLEALHEMWPDSDVYTTVYLPEYLGPHRKRFDGWKIKTSILQYIPLKAKLISFFRFVDYFIFKNLDLTKYDLVIVSSAGSYSGLNYFKKSKKTIHLCYYHTPPRYLYGYSTANRWTTNTFRKFLLFLGQIPIHFLRILDFKNAQLPDYLLSNSKEIKERIRKFYRREATVIYPPYDIPKLRTVKTRNSHNYFLAGGRLARAKRVDLAVSACTKLSLPLKVFGKQFAGYGDELKTISGSTVEFLGEVSEQEKYELMAGAKAFIFPSDTEDFGITPIEAMAMGTPVIAHRSGGVIESVVDKKTGLFFDDHTIESIVQALKQSEKIKWDRKRIKQNAQKFSKERFVREVKNYVSSIIK